MSSSPAASPVITSSNKHTANSHNAAALHSTSVLLNNNNNNNANNDNNNNDNNNNDIGPPANSDWDDNDPSIDAASLADAAHLDQLESSEAVADIASFGEIQLNDVDLGAPPQQRDLENGNGNNVAANNDISNNNNNGTTAPPPDSIRRAKKFYYCLPMLNKHKFPILWCVSVCCVLFVAVGFGVGSLEEGMDAEAAALGASDGGGDGDGGSNSNGNGGGSNGNGGNGGGATYGGVVIDDAPSDYMIYGDDSAEILASTNNNNDEEEDHEEVGDNAVDHTAPEAPEVPRGGDDNDNGGDLELGEVMVHEAIEAPEVPRDDDEESGSSAAGAAAMPQPASPNTTPNATPSPTKTPTFPPHPLNPKWYSTSDEKYSTLIEENRNEGHHSHLMAGLFCLEFDLFLCGYNEYCPNGKSKQPYKDGPPKTANWNSLEAVQWAPILTTETSDLSSNQGGSWVQVGSIPESDGGSIDNEHGSCWTYDDWGKGSGGDIEDEWTEDHRRWILCCETEDTGEGWNGDWPDD